MPSEEWNDRVQKILLWIVLVALVIATIFFFRQNTRLRVERERLIQWVRGVKVGEKAPPISVQGLGGENITLGYSGRGPKHVLLFFSPTCQLGDEQFLYWKQIIQRADRNQFEVLALVADFEDHTKMQQYLKANGLNFGSEPSLRVAFVPPSVRLVYGLVTPPTTILVSNVGTVEEIWIGKWDEETARNAGKVFGFTFSPS